MSHVNHVVGYDADHHSKVRKKNMFVAVSAALAGLLFGLDLGVVSWALPVITEHFQPTAHAQESLLGSMILD